MEMNLDEIIKATEFLPNSVPLPLRKYCILNSITEIPKCICGNPVTYKKDYPNKGFAQYCSPKCSRSNKTVSDSKLLFLKDKEWLYTQRITLKKSKELIAEELEVSTTVINKYLKLHEIPKVKYNESNSLAKQNLNHKFLYQEHIINHRSCEDIANQLNVSKSTISVHLAKHNIIANPSNSYEIKTSKECLEVVDFIKSFYNKPVILDTKSILGSLEIDIYLPEDNFAIEYNGIYSHIYRPNEQSFSLRKDHKYHLFKTDKCLEKNIFLLHLLSTDWKQNKLIWKSFIKNKLKLTENKFFARKCIIKEVSTYEKNIFLSENHVQGNAPASYKIGLYYNDELVSLMTFQKPRYNKNYDYELVRFCNKINTNVVGGFSKLLKYFRSSNPGSIISYANRNYSQGDLYLKNGFKLISKNNPSYWYVDLNTETVYHKSNFKKSNLLKKLNKPELTEKELSIELGYNILYDTGQLVYVLD